MPFPAGVQTVTLTAGAGGYRALDGDAYQGTIRLTPSVSRVVSATHGVIALGVENITLGASGEFSKTLLATDASGFSPSGWTYRVDEELTNAPGKAYNISLPASAANPTLSALVEVESSSGTVSSPAVLSVNGDTGVVTGLLEAASNLSDVASTVTARSNLAAAPTATVQGRNPITGYWYPSAYGAVGDYAADDTATVQACIDACSAAGGGVVLIGQHVVSGSGIHPKTGVTLRGIPGYSKLKNSTSNVAISSSTTCSDIGFEDFTIEGPVNQTVSVPTRARTTSGPGTTMGIWLTGDLDTTVVSPPVITNVVIRNVTIRNTTELPIRIFGVRGRVLTENCRFYNCKDAGWGFNEEVVVTNCHSYMSFDNGFSISRGNTKVTCTGNTVEMAAYNGIWLSGYLSTAGPTDFTCTGTTVKNVGHCGILLQDAPKNGVVTGNIIDKAWVRGDSSAPTDDYIFGIMIRGNSATPGTPGTSVASGIRVADNTIYAAPRAGVSIDGATACVVEDNLIVDTGTAFFADGTTPITSSFTSQNIGVLCSYPTTLTACTIRNNTIIDSRGAPLTNRGVFPVRISGALITGNTMEGCRNSTNLPATLDAWNDNRLDGGQETLRRTEATAATLTMSSGTLRLAYLTARRNATVTAIRVSSGTTAAAATPTLIRFGLYSVDPSTGALTLMSATTSDTAVFAAITTAYSRTLTAAQQVAAGQQYAIGVLVVTGTTPPTVTGMNIAPGGEAQQIPVLANNLTGQTDLPASIAAGSLTATASVVYAVAVGA